MLSGNAQNAASKRPKKAALRRRLRANTPAGDRPGTRSECDFSIENERACVRSVMLVRDHSNRPLCSQAAYGKTPVFEGYGRYKLRKNSCFVSGHDFRRAVLNAPNEGSPPTLRLGMARLNPCPSLDDEAFPNACVALSPFPPLLDLLNPFRGGIQSRSDGRRNRQWRSHASQAFASRNEAAHRAI
jgi:hypothetical protein